MLAIAQQLCLYTLLLTAVSTERKNIILILTDDQDVELGSMQYMPKTRKLLQEKGVDMSGGFVTTPICCPSRSTILSGLYVHNHNVHTNNQNCSGTQWRSTFEPRTFGTYLHESGYATAYMGKYLNEYDGSYVPPGWSYWMGLIRNSRFYNYTVNLNGTKKKYGNHYEKDYFTDVITNESIRWLSNHLYFQPTTPFLSVLSFPAPHGPEDPAPQYAHMFNDVESHRTDAWNYAPNPDKQWLLQHTGKMQPIHVAFTDILHRRRLQTLQSVDEAVHKVLTLIRDFNQLSNTYIIYTSDHGYHLGQFGLIKGKNMPYEFDIRVPFLIRGPGIPRNITIRKPVGNIDIAPTILDMAGIPVPSHMDGRSILELITLQKDGKKRQQLDPWRDTILIERGKMPKLKKIRDRFLRQKARFSKEVQLSNECSSGKWSGNCGKEQDWKCYMAEDGRWRIYKCRMKKERKQCNCEREKRSIGDSIPQSQIEDDFLREAHEKRILDSHQWFQGTFGIDVAQKKLRGRRQANHSCDCARNNTEHPLKTTPFDEILYEDPFIKRRKKNGKPILVDESCSVPQMNCFTHGSSHWRTPPLWPQEYGEFCFCQNSNNNTYWCLRTMNETHNFLYCEFVTEFISYYDLNNDPFQLTNEVYNLELSTLEELSAQLRELRTCKGTSECERAASQQIHEHSTFHHENKSFD